MSDYPEQVGASPTLPPTQTSRAGGVAPANVQMISSRRCPNCGTAVPAGSSVCSACGERLETKPRKVRCRQCGGAATSQLVICPHCGRELRAAAPRAVTWGLPLLAALLLLVLLVSQWGRLSPFGWLGRQSVAAASWISEFGASLDPQVALLSAAGEPSVEIVGASGAQDGPNAFIGADTALAAQANPPAAAASDPLTASQVITALIPTATVAAVNTPAPIAAPTDTPTVEPPTATPLPTATPTTTPTPPPTETPTQAPTESPTPAPTNTASAKETATVKPTISVVVTTTRTSRLSATPVQTATLSASQEQIQAASAVTVTTTITPSAVMTVSKSLLPTPTATLVLTASAPVNTPVSAALSLPTPTPEPALPTATPALQFYEVKPGDTVLGIALRLGLEMNDLMLANNLTAQDARLLRPGQKLVIPVIDATAQSADAPSAPTPAGAIYTVRSGDTIVGIAARTGIAVEAILAANKMTAADAPTIQPGDTLVLPAPGATIVPLTPTSTPTSSPTPVDGPTPTLTPTVTRIPPTPTATPVLLRLPAPTLRSPENGASVSCAVADKLVWSPVDFVLNTDKYRLHLGYVSGKDAAGNGTVTWVIEQLQPAGLTQWNMDVSLCSLAPQELGRQWRWYVDVVEIIDGVPVPVSPPSSVWGFAWN
jgi:LysM repeat protein